MMNIKSGDIVMFKEVKDKGDENAQMVVLDDYGKDCERCLVKYLNTGLPLPPQQVVLKEELRTIYSL